ncbi:hypothetical protein Nos7107_3842 [Nostoc sp. PCC 7107]|nr:hypothetical protein Nos7107_3842 [Nostoc sp. PCC 7107]
MRSLRIFPRNFALKSLTLQNLPFSCLSNGQFIASSGDEEMIRLVHKIIESYPQESKRLIGIKYADFITLVALAEKSI